MLVIRYQRVGRKNDASFRIVVTEHTTGPKSGKNVEQLGSYNPKTKALNLNADRIKHWISVGAQVSDTVHNLLVREGVVEGAKRNSLPKKSPIAKEVVEEEKKEAPSEGEEKFKEEAPVEEEEKKEEAPAEEEKKEEAAA